MGWAKLDDKRYTNTKMMQAGLEANGLDANGLSYAAAHETDGFVPDVALKVLAFGARSPRKVAQRLEDVGRWRRDEPAKGWWIVNYLEFNPSRRELEERRERDRERKKISERNPSGIQSDSEGLPSDPSRAPASRPAPAPPDPEEKPQQPPTELTLLKPRIDQVCKALARRQLDRERVRPERPGRWVNAVARDRYDAYADHIVELFRENPTISAQEAADAIEATNPNGHDLPAGWR